MENKVKTSKDVILNYGLLLGFASIIVASANYALGNPYKPHWSISIISIVISTVFIVMGIKKVKQIQQGNLTLGEAIKTGLGISLLSGILYVFFFLILTTFVEPDFYVKVMEIQKETMIEQYPDFSDEQLESSLAMAEKFTKPWITAAFALIGSLFFGFIISLIGGLVMKGEAPYKELDEL